ncbi:MAG: GntR family transcriptional regulator [Lachnospiraceae bacterium]|nr:GntR family transcriptional regulator [Lachnospiraceae bacterium]
MQKRSDMDTQTEGIYSDRIDPNSSVSLSKQLEMIFRSFIKDGIWLPDQLIPSEMELCKMFLVGRGSVRTAMKKLEDHKLVYRVRGRGTAVIPKQLDSTIPFTGVQEAIWKKSKENHEELKVLFQEERSVDGHAAENLRLSLGDKILYVERCTVTEKMEQLRSFQYIYIPYMFYKRIDRTKIGVCTFHELFSQAGIFETDREEWLSVSSVTKKESEKFGIEEGAPVFILEVLRYDQEDRPFYYMKIVRLGESLKVHFSTR